MILRSRVRDCLFLNWALPRPAIPDPPPSLRYETHHHDGADWVFASALLFRQEGIHFLGVPWARASYPQATLRFYTRDRDDVPSVLFRSMWVPRWVSPAVRAIGRQPVRSAGFDYPASVEESDATFAWRVSAGDALEVTAVAGDRVSGVGPSLGDWHTTVSYFRQRPRGYAVARSGLRRVETTHVSASIWPMRATLRQGALLRRSVGLEDEWPALHTAWVCPELAFEFEVLPESEAAIPRSVPAPG